MNLMRGALCGLLVWLWAGVAMGAAIEGQDLEAFVDGFVKARMEAHRVAGVTIAVVKDDELLLAKGFGSADIEAGRPVVADQTLFRPGSISKLFTWTAIMQLVEQGRLDLKADIRTYLPDFPLQTRFATPITLNHLMAHTPGFEETAMGHLFENEPDEVMTLRDYLRRYHPEQVRPPGTWPAYSNFGVALAGLIVAETSGMSWEAYAERYLFTPLGMNDSTFREPWGSQRPGQPMAAGLRERVSEGYQWIEGAFRPGGFEFISGIGPAGALSTTATDMARFMLAHLGQGTPEYGQMLERDTLEQMHRQHFTAVSGQPGMAHGFIESEIEGYRAIGHGGGSVHFVSDFQLIPELELGVFISTNTSGGGQALIRGFVRHLVGRYFTSDNPPSTAPSPANLQLAGVDEPANPERYVGDYLSTRRPYTTVESLLNHDLASVRMTGDGQLLLGRRGEQVRLLNDTAREGEGRFRVADTLEPVTFVMDSQGSVTHLAVPEPILVMERVGILDNPRWRLSFLGVAGLVFIGAIVAAWMRRYWAPAARPEVRWASRLTVLAGALWVVSLLTGVAGVVPIVSDVRQVFYGFPTPVFEAAQYIAMLAALVTLMSLITLPLAFLHSRWTWGRRVRHGLMVGLLTLTLVTFWQFNGFVLMT